MPKPIEIVYPRQRERFERRRKEREDRKLLDQFFDHPTLLAVGRLINDGAFDQLDFPIATGKEGGVFRATKGSERRAVKIYRIDNSSYRRLPPYALSELTAVASIRNFQGLIVAWTRREHTLLGRLTDAGVRVPRPFALRRNVLVMEYIGDDRGPAPRLRDAVIEDPDELYGALVREFRRMVVGARLVHGDLSPYNTLYFDRRPVVIDVGQSVSVDHPEAPALLRRDLDHFSAFLRRQGLAVEADEFYRAVGGPSSEATGAL